MISLEKHIVFILAEHFTRVAATPRTIRHILKVILLVSFFDCLGFQFRLADRLFCASLLFSSVSPENYQDNSLN